MVGINWGNRPEVLVSLFEEAGVNWDTVLESCWARELASEAARSKVPGGADGSRELRGLD